MQRQKAKQTSFETIRRRETERKQKDVIKSSSTPSLPSLYLSFSCLWFQWVQNWICQQQILRFWLYLYILHLQIGYRANRQKVQHILCWRISFKQSSANRFDMIWYEKGAHTFYIGNRHTYTFSFRGALEWHKQWSIAMGALRNFTCFVLLNVSIWQTTAFTIGR